MRNRELVLASVLAAAIGLCRGSLADTPRSGPAPHAAAASHAALPKALHQAVQAAVTAELDQAEKDGDFDAAASRLDTLFDQVAALGTERTLDSFRDAAFARRMVSQLRELPAEQRVDMLKFLRAHDALARTMAFLVESNSKRGRVAGEPYAVLQILREKFGEQVDKYANLAAAICVVHDVDYKRQINESLTVSPSAEDLFKYYTTNEKYMLFGIKQVPAELLVYVVDTTASIDDMTWALKKYAGDQAIGKHFFDVAYDYDNFRTGKAKKVTSSYTLPNILKWGGVCADQAFFAVSIGKAIGVPTAYATGASGEAGHAWVGFLQAAGNHGFWNFDVGRYPEYRGVKGNVMDPETRAYIPDSYVSVLGELIGRNPADRQAAVALADAAERLSGPGDAISTTSLGKILDGKTPPRIRGTAGALELLEMALNQNAGYPRAWFEVRTLAQDGKLTLAEKIKWSNAVMKLCGSKYPDFAAALLEPMIKTVEDPARQNQLWEAAFGLFQARMDLGADIRMHQAKLWEDQKETSKAGRCYEEVISRYANAGPFVLAAVAGAEKLLEGKPEKILQLYEQTWSKTKKPQDMAAPFMRQSNWYRVGSMYAQKLAAAGQDAKAAEVLAQLGVSKIGKGR